MKVEKILERVIEVAICGLVFIIPFSKAGIEIFGITAIIGWILKTLLARSNPLASLPKHITFTLSLVIIATLLSCIESVAFMHSLKAFFTKTLEYMLFFVITIATFSNRKKMKILLQVMCVSLVLFLVNGIVQYIFGFDLVRRNPLAGIRITSSMLSPNDFSTYIIIFIPILFGFVIAKYQSLKHRITAFIIFSMSLFCLFFSYTRAAWIGFIASMLFFVFVKNKWLLLTAALILIVFSFMIKDFVNDDANEAAIKDKISTSFSANIRFLMAKEAVSMIIDYPILGAGFNAYTIAIPKYKVHPQGGIYPHNSYLHMIAETGLVGIGVFFLFVWSLYSEGIRALWSLSSKRFTGSNEYIIIRGLMAGLFGLLVNACFDTTLYALMLITTFWVITGVLIAIRNIAKRTSNNLP